MSMQDVIESNPLFPNAFTVFDKDSKAIYLTYITWSGDTYSMKPVHINTTMLEINDDELQPTPTSVLFNRVRYVLEQDVGEELVDVNFLYKVDLAEQYDYIPGVTSLPIFDIAAVHPKCFADAYQRVINQCIIASMRINEEKDDIF